MKIIFFVLITICIIGAALYLLNSLVNRIFNIKAYLGKSEKKNGLIYNPKTKKLEADQSTITLY